VLVALVIANSTLFTVSQTDQALMVRLGEPLRVVTEPGLNFKVPFLDSVYRALPPQRGHQRRSLAR
jgi:modulator of FtsH protease HflC